MGFWLSHSPALHSPKDSSAQGSKDEDRFFFPGNCVQAPQSPLTPALLYSSTFNSSLGNPCELCKLIAPGVCSLQHDTCPSWEDGPFPVQHPNYAV